MIFYESPTEEAGALRRAAARVGCKVERLRVQGRRVVGRVVCRDGWQAAEFLAALGVEDATTPGAKILASEIIGGPGVEDVDFAAALMAWVKAHVRFVRDVGEVFSSPGYTLEIGEGDCEDQARIVYAVARAAGLPARFAFLHRGAGPTHAVAQVYAGGAWRWAETTVDARLGEHPIKAARRLGVVASRGDIAEGVRFMSDENLPAPPAGYRGANSAEQVERDADALASLGFLQADEPRAPGDPADPVFREAVHAFQTSAGVTADGLIGPQTRRALAGALPEEKSTGYLGALVKLSLQGGQARALAALTPGFFRGVEAMAADFRARGAQVTAEQFLAVWLYESGLRSDIPNGSGAPFYGLNQMGIPQLKGAGWTDGPLAWMALSPEQQLPYVRRYYENTVKATAPEDFAALRGDWSKLVGIPVLYALNLAPAFASRAADLDAPIVRKNAEGTSLAATAERQVYGGNVGLDEDRNGFISGGDLKRAVARAQRQAGDFWIEVRRRLYAEGGTDPTVAERVPGVAGAILIVAVPAALAAWALSSS